MLIVTCHDQCRKKRQMTDTLNLSLQTEVSVTVYEIKGHEFDIVIYAIGQMDFSNYAYNIFRLQTTVDFVDVEQNIEC